ncbi:MAG: hypothetical protein CMO55_08020 [Verrucomicrobiales bacterium]|nr:hypothetical protein [Verrucomicrobiales bacterium]
MGEAEIQRNDSEHKEGKSSFDHLVDLCERGMLYEAEEWLTTGHVATRPEGSDDCPLRTATRMGFHSLVKLLLDYGCTGDQKLDSLAVAAYAGNLDICKLLVEANAPVGELYHEHLDDVIRRPLIEYLLDHGLDLTQRNGLAHLFVNCRVKPLLGIFLRYRDQFPEWENQAAMALCEFVHRRDKKWVSLMIWAGADPFLPVPDLSEITDESEEDIWKHTAAELAAWLEDPDLLKLLRINPTAEQATRLLFSAWSRPTRSLVEPLIAAGADVNGYSEEEGSLLHKALHSFAVRGDYWRPRTSPEEEVELISMLIRKGAKWRLPKRIREADWLRRRMYAQDGPFVVEVIRLLHAGECCETAFLKDFVNKPKMRDWIRTFDPKLYGELDL